jgi:glycosyltransferase involved in cell wall biosynthesis
MTETVTVCIPAIPPRLNTTLRQALESVYAQDRVVDAISIAVDTEHMGAWHTRQRAADAALTEWIAFLDDDDLFKPMHIRRLLECARDTQSDYVYSYFDTTVTPDILGYFGKLFDPADPHHTTMTILVRTDLTRQVRFTPRLPEHVAGGEDWRFMLGCVAASAKIVHLPEETWIWRHWGGNTSGREDRW